MTFRNSENLAKGSWTIEGKDLTKEFYEGVNERWKVNLLLGPEVNIPEKYNIVYTKFLRQEIYNVKNLWDLAELLSEMFDDFKIKALDKNVLESWVFMDDKKIDYQMIENFLKQYFMSLSFTDSNKILYFPKYEDILQGYDKYPIFWDRNNEAYFDQISDGRYCLLDNYKDDFSSWTVKKGKFNEVMAGVDNTLYLTRNIINKFRSENLQATPDENLIKSAKQMKALRVKILELEGYMKSLDLRGRLENKRKFQNFLTDVAKGTSKFAMINVENFSYENKDFTQKIIEEKTVIEAFSNIYNAFYKNFEISVGGISLAVQEGVDGALSVVDTKGGLSEPEG